MGYLFSIVLILGGILALSGVIVAKKPDAREYIEKLMPYKAFIGVALLALGIIAWLQIGPINLFRLVKLLPFLGFVSIAAVFSGILLGFMFGAPQIAQWTNQPQAKVENLNLKLAPYQLILGVVALGAGFLLLLLNLGIMKPTF